MKTDSYAPTIKSITASICDYCSHIRSDPSLSSTCFLWDNGHYRANSLIDNANKEMVYASKKMCIECHADIGEKLHSDLHASLSCVVCHGPGLEHANSPKTVKIIKMSGRENCGRCHALNPARLKEAVDQIDVVEHHKDKNDCIECHNPHAVWELKK